MTNYEWLVKSGKLHEFIFDISFHGTKDALNCELINKKYGILLIADDKIGGNNARKITAWLQAERTTKRYVDICDVYQILQTPLKFCAEREYTQKEFVQIVSDYVVNLLAKVNDLDVKEIDE